ncbi:hypothetical protein A6U87_20640 [Rhizobium sp. AC44/96]|nr:hypothetical protein [Rhizobium sp. S96]OCJ17220.1 hypothetical protein A6U87_20640 [Rhizobium sp. AC44/96]
MTQFFETTQVIMAMGAVIGCGSFAAGALTLAAIQGARSRGSGAGARSLAMLTVLALDDFVGASYAAVHDSPAFNPMDEGEFAFHALEPVFALPRDADWALFGDELSDEIMWLSNRVSNLSHALDSLDLASPGYDRFFERRQQGYAELASKALDLIDRLLGEFDLHLPAKPDYYRQREGFAAILKTGGETNLRTKKVALMSNGSNITQLFPKTGEEAE